MAPRAVSEARGEITSKQRFCFLAGITVKVFDRLIVEGMPVVEAPTGKGDQFKIATAQAWQWMMDRVKPANGSASTSGPVFDIERARLTKEQADGHELRNAELRSQLLPEAEVVAGWAAATGRARSLLIGIATSAPTTLLMIAKSHEPQDAERLVRENLTRWIDAALLELQNTSLDAEDDDEAQPTDDSRAA